MKTNLFRQEVYENKKRRLLGDVLLVQPLSVKMISAFLIVSFTVAFLLLFYVEFGSSESIVGKVVKADRLTSSRSDRQLKSEFIIDIIVPFNSLEYISEINHLSFILLLGNQRIGRIDGSLVTPIKLAQNQSSERAEISVKVLLKSIRSAAH